MFQRRRALRVSIATGGGGWGKTEVTMVAAGSCLSRPAYRERDWRAILEDLPESRSHHENKHALAAYGEAIMDG